MDPGDWAILKVKEPIDLPALNVNLAYGFDFADPIFRLGNDYSKGIILSTGYVGQRTNNKLVTCLTDGHPGVSGGGVLNRSGDLVGIPIGRMQGDFRFSFILPLREEMFRKVEAPAVVVRGGAQIRSRATVSPGFLLYARCQVRSSCAACCGHPSSLRAMSASMPRFVGW